jgi:hypothetical protein
MAYLDKTPAHIRLDECNHVEKPLLDSSRALRLEEPFRG